MELVTGPSTQGYDPVEQMPGRCSRRTIAAVSVVVVAIITISVLLTVNVHTTTSSTSEPTASPTSEPTTSPTSEPTTSPTSEPTPAPTPAPTAFSVCSSNNAVAGPTLNNRTTDTACAFADGRVMVTGRSRLANGTHLFLNESAIWSPLTNQWSANAYPSDLLVHLHTWQAALVRLSDTSLLLFGGHSSVGPNNASLRFANDSWGTLSPSPAFAFWTSDLQRVVVPAGVVVWSGDLVAYYHTSNHSWTTRNKTGDIEESRACLMPNNTIISVGGYVTGSSIIDFQFYVMPDNSTLEGVWYTMNGSEILSRYAHNVVCTPTHGVYVAGGVSVFDDSPMSSVARWFNGVWTSVQPIPAGQSRVYAAMMQSNPSNFVVIGGAYGWDEEAALTPSVLIYTLANDTWSLGPSLAPGRAEAPVVLAGNRFMVLGGYNYPGSVDTIVHAIDLVCVV